MSRSTLSKWMLTLLMGGAMGSFSVAYADEAADVTRLLKAGSLDQALARADAFLASRPRDPQMRFLKGLVLTEQGKASEAIRIFSKLTEDYPELPEPYNNLAVLHAGQGQYEKARQSLEMAIRTHPTYATAYENLGDVYSKLASQSYDKALQLDTNNTAAETKLSMVREMISGRRPAAAPTPTAAPAPAPAPVQVAAAPPPPAPVPVAAAPVPAPAPAPAVQPPTRVSANALAAASAAASAPTTAATIAATTTAAAISTTTAGASAAAPQVPAPAPAASPSVASTQQPVLASVGGGKANDADVMRTVREWAQAWSNQNVEDYLAYYSGDFEPQSGQSRASWERERRNRINGKSRIEIRVESPIIVYDSGQATVQFKQTYVSDRFTNVSVKTLVLAKSGSRWMIVREKSSG